MAKYVYLSYIMWEPELTQEVFLTKIRPRLENEEVELISFGPVFGVLEDGLLIHRTDLELADFIDFRTKAVEVDGKGMIDHARTIVSTPRET